MHDAHDPATWDARYASHDERMWSGRPNGGLVVEVATMRPGRVLDVGCGEGADAIWLAQQGWQVDAIDVSTVALERAGAAAEAVGVAVRWLHGSVVTTDLPGAPYDLVSIQYPALPTDGNGSALQRVLDAIAPGGVLLVVGHHLDPEVVRAHGHEPEHYLGVDDMAAQLDDRFQVDVHEIRPRVDPPPGAAAVDDVVLRATRR